MPPIRLEILSSREIKEKIIEIP
jgi:hypothetical protein